MKRAKRRRLRDNYETNYGSLGAMANGDYADWRINMAMSMGLRTGGGNVWAPTNIYLLHQIPGAITGDPDTAINIFGAANNQASYIVIPRTDARTTIKPPFTLEAWVRPEDNQGWVPSWPRTADSIIIWLPALTGAALTGFIPAPPTPSACRSVIERTLATIREPKTTASYPPGVWYHVVTEFDGTNVSYWINGVQDPLQNSPTCDLSYTPSNTWDPLTIGCARGLNANTFRGSMDEVAVYTNLLAVNDITNHYYSGTNGFGNYKNLVLADNPLLYYRMDAPQYVAPPLSTWPVLTNYGSVGIDGVYTPNSVPGGGPVPSVNGVPISGLSANNSFQSDGTMTFADAGFVPQFSPTGADAIHGRGLDERQSCGYRARLARHRRTRRQRFPAEFDAGNATTGKCQRRLQRRSGGGADIGNARPPTT